MQKRIGLGIVGAFAVVAVGCAGSSRSTRAASGESAGTPVANAAEAGGAAASAQARQARQAQGAAQAQASPARQVEGRVERIDRANDVTLAGTEGAGHAFDKMKLDENTQVTVNGQQATIADVEEGDDVRATFSAKGDELHLDRVEVLPQGE